jgi:Fanconi anemia group M protein
MLERWDELGDYARLVKTEGLEVRDYQANIIKTISSGKNTLVVLPTGLGKTLIAVFAAARILYSEKKVVFLAPTKPLSEQHFSSISSFLDVESGTIALLTGEVRSARRKQIWEDSMVIVATPQTMANDLKSGNVSLDGVGLVIFDECHRSIGRYAYTYVAEGCKLLGIQIIGLTASPGSDRKKIKELISILGIRTIEARTSSDLDVAPYIKGKRMRTIYVDKGDTISRIERVIKPDVDKHLMKLYQIGISQFKGFDGMPKGRLIEMGRAIDRIEAKNYKFGAVFNYVYVLNLSHALDLLTTEGLFPFCSYMDSLAAREKKSKGVASILNNEEISKCVEDAKSALSSGEEHPKMHMLVDILKNDFAGKRAIIFAQYRSTIKKITDVLKNSGILAEAFIGKKDGVTVSQQNATISDFRNGKFDVLVSTSIGEEGLDIPIVDAVIFYEPVPSAIRNIQRKGRTGRIRFGDVVVLVTRGTKDETYLMVSRMREKKMMEILEEMKYKLDRNDSVESRQSRLI